MPRKKSLNFCAPCSGKWIDPPLHISYRHTSKFLSQFCFRGAYGLCHARRNPVRHPANPVSSALPSVPTVTITAVSKRSEGRYHSRGQLRTRVRAPPQACLQAPKLLYAHANDSETASVYTRKQASCCPSRSGRRISARDGRRRARPSNRNPNAARNGERPTISPQERMSYCQRMRDWRNTQETVIWLRAQLASFDTAPQEDDHDLR